MPRGRPRTAPTPFEELLHFGNGAVTFRWYCSVRSISIPTDSFESGAYGMFEGVTQRLACKYVPGYERSKYGGVIHDDGTLNILDKCGPITYEGDVVVDQMANVQSIKTNGSVSCFGGASVGDIEARGDVTVNPNARVGDIKTDGSVIVDAGARVGNVQAGKDVYLLSKSGTGFNHPAVHSYAAEAAQVQAGGTVSLEAGAVAGGIAAGTAVKLGGDWLTREFAHCGNIHAGQSVTLNNGAQAQDIRCDGDVHLDPGAQAKDIHSLGSVTLEADGTLQAVAQNIVATGDVELMPGAIACDVKAGGTVVRRPGDPSSSNTDNSLRHLTSLLEQGSYTKPIQTSGNEKETGAGQSFKSKDSVEPQAVRVSELSASAEHPDAEWFHTHPNWIREPGSPWNGTDSDLS